MLKAESVTINYCLAQLGQRDRLHLLHDFSDGFIICPKNIGVLVDLSLMMKRKGRLTMTSTGGSVITSPDVPVPTTAVEAPALVPR